MGNAVKYKSLQGLTGYQISLDDGEFAIITLHKASFDYYIRGGGLWTVFPGSGAQVSADHSLVMEGDFWSPEIGSPFSEITERREPHRIPRTRFGSVGATGVIHVLYPSPFTVSIA